MFGSNAQCVLENRSDLCSSFDRFCMYYITASHTVRNILEEIPRRKRRDPTRSNCDKVLLQQKLRNSWIHNRITSQKEGTIRCISTSLLTFRYFSSKAMKIPAAEAAVDKQ